MGWAPPAISRMERRVWESPMLRLQIFPCLVAASVCDDRPHPLENPCPHFSILKKVCFKITKSGNSTHKHTPNLKNGKGASPLRKAPLLYCTNIFRILYFATASLRGLCARELIRHSIRPDAGYRILYKLLCIVELFRISSIE